MGVLSRYKPDISRLEGEKDVNGLINALGHKEPEVRDEAIRALIKIGVAAVDTLVPVVFYNDSIIREGAAEALAGIGDYLVIVIRGGLIKYGNSALYRLIGYSEHEILNKQFTDFVAPEYEELVLERYKKRLKEESVPGTYEIEILTKDGGRMMVSLRASRTTFEGRPAYVAILRIL